MDIGILNEQSHSEMRVALTPRVIISLVNKNNRVFIEKGAGEGSKFSDQDFIDAGAQIVYSKEEAIRRGELVLMVSPVNKDECALLRKDQVVMSFHHLAVQNKEIVDCLMKKNITAIGYEIIEDKEGDLPVLVSMSEIAGQLSMHIAAELMQTTNGGRGILLANTPGTSPPVIVILGAGVVGLSAARMAMGMGAQVIVIDNDIKKIRRADEVLGKQAMTWYASKSRIDRACEFADVLVGAILVPGGKTPHIITEKHVKSMKRAAVIIDASIDQGGCIETSRPTTILKPTFEQHRVIHYCVPNMTSHVARTASQVLSNATMRYIFEVTRLGIKEALKNDISLAKGIYTYNGQCTEKNITDIFGYECAEIKDMI